MTETENIYIKLQIDTKQFDSSMAGIKKEMATLRGQVGNSLLSPADQQALTKRLGTLKNQLDDLRMSANNIDTGDVFGNMAKLGGVAANAVAGVTGAMSLLGVESSKTGEVEKKILQFMAVGNALQSVADAKRLKALMLAYVEEVKALALKTKEIVVRKLTISTIEKEAVAEAASTKAKTIGAAVTQLITKAQWAWNAAIAANPIGLLIVAVAALAAGVYLLVKAFNKSGEAVKDYERALDGTVIKDEKLRTAHNETIKTLKELDIEYRLLTGKITEHDAAIEKLYFNLEVASKESKDKLSKDLLELQSNFTKFKEFLFTIRAVDAIEALQKWISGDKYVSKKNWAAANKLAEEEYAAQIDREKITKEKVKAENEKAAIELAEQNKKNAEEARRAAEEARKKAEADRKRAEEEAFQNSLKMWEASTNAHIAEMQKEWDRVKAIREQEDADMLELEKQSDAIGEVTKKNVDKKVKVVLSGEQKINDETQKILDKRKEIFGGFFTELDNLNPEERLKAFSEVAIATTEVLVESIYAIMSVQAAKLAQSVAESQSMITESFNKNMSDLDRALKYGIISQETYNREKLKAEKELADKEKALKNETAKKEKETAIFAAVINTAQSVAGALAAPPYVPYTIPMGILAGILGGIQIAAIAATPVPQYALGGPIYGASHSQGGVPINAEGGEYIIKSSVAQRPGMGSFLDKVNTGQVTNVTNNNNNMDTTVIESIVQSTIAGITSIPVINVESNSTRVQRKVSNIETKSSW